MTSALKAAPSGDLRSALTEPLLDGGLSPSGTYTGDPPPGLNVRRAFFGWKSDEEVCGGVVSVV